MNKILLPMLALVIVTACVDDYTDANPRPKLDAPTLRVSESGDNQVIVTTPANRFQNTLTAYATNSGTSTFTVSVIDAPGTIGEVSVTGSVPDFGVVAVDESSVAAIQGQETGEFTFTFTPNEELDDEDRSMNLTIAVSDNQVSEDGEEAPKTTTVTVPLNIVRCVSEAVQGGTWMLTEASGNLDGGATYNLDTLKKYGEVEQVVIEIDEERPGSITISDVTASLWPIYYPGRALPTVTVDVCGNSIEGSFVVGGLRNFTVDGTVNGDGTITLSWSYVRADATPTPANPAKGTYTLTRL